MAGSASGKSNAKQAAVIGSSRGPRSRARAACLNCRERHSKCDEQRPECLNCRRFGEQCRYEERNVFIMEAYNATLAKDQSIPRTLSRRHTMAGGGVIQRDLVFQDETSSISSEYRVLPNSPPPPTQQFPSPAPLAIRHESVESPIHAPSTEEYIRRHSFSPNTLPLTSPSIASIASPAVSVHQPPPQPITDPTDTFFFRRFVEIIAVWFDLFDREKHFALLLPHIALATPVVMKAALACAARQHSLVTGYPTDRALEYYNAAIHLLLPILASPTLSSDPAILAACLLLGHFEMIGERSSDWQSHLSGSRGLIVSHGWNGSSGGLAQASFWIYARMDTWAAIASGTRIRHPSHLWSPSQMGTGKFGDWANRITYILGKVHEYHVEAREGREDVAKWRELRSELDRWNRSRPIVAEPLSVFTNTADSMTDESGGGQCVFEVSTWYADSAVASAMQMYDTAKIILFCAHPLSNSSSALSPGAGATSRYDLFLTHPSIPHEALRAAQSIADNSIRNDGHIAWVNATVSLFISGRLLQSAAQRKALVKVLENVRSETGWYVKERMEWLVREWGWEGVAWRDMGEGELEELAVRRGESGGVEVALVRMFEGGIAGGEY
ncbi:hypothetical protein YB2330_003764 [Saitoella coloradoensis]